MPSHAKPIKTAELVRAVKSLGFVANPPRGMHTVFEHPEGAVVTIPTGRREIPDVFVKAIVGQVRALDIPSVDTITRFLADTPPS